MQAACSAAGQTCLKDNRFGCNVYITVSDVLLAIFAIFETVCDRCRQLWGTGARAPLDYQKYHFQFTLE